MKLSGFSSGYVDSVKPHTATFGNYSMLTNLSTNSTACNPNRNGSPTISLLPKAVEATIGHYLQRNRVRELGSPVLPIQARQS